MPLLELVCESDVLDLVVDKSKGYPDTRSIPSQNHDHDIR